MNDVQRPPMPTSLSDQWLRVVLQVLVCVGISLLLMRQIAWAVLTSQLSNDKPTLGPRVLVPKIVQDLGDVPIHSRQSVTLRVRNAGDERLILRERSADCACILPDSETVIVPCRETASISIHFDAWAPDVGSDGCEVRSFETNDPSQPRVILMVRYRVKPATQTSPRQPIAAVKIR